jgi:hypothetical protein
MIKKYVMIVAVLLVILMFTSTSTASFGSYEGNVYEMLREKFQKDSAIKNMFDKLSQVISDQKDSMSIDTDDEDDEDDDGNDGEYDDGEHDGDPDDQKEDGLLPKIWVLDGEKTPHEGNYTDEGDDENITNTIDHPSGDGVVVWDNGTVNPDGNVNATNGITIGEGEWTVEHDGEGGTLERFVEIVMECDEKLGALLQWVIDGSTDGNGFFSGSTWIAGEDTKADGVVEGGSVGTPGVDNDDVVVLTDDG